MDLLNILWPSKRINIFFLLLSFVLTITFSLPVIIPPTDPFYSIDPDIPYIANSLKITALNQTSFTNHPGTPYQTFLSFSYWPLRIWAKLISLTPFIKWSLLNFVLLLWYSRIVMAIWFFLGVYLLLTGWFLISGSATMPLIGISALMLLPSIPASVMTINAESFMLGIFSIWMIFVLLYSKKQKILFSYLIFFLAGILIGTKLTSIVLIPISIELLVFYNYTHKKKFILSLILCISFLFFGFVTSTWPIRDRYINLFNWGMNLFTHTDLYGGGKNTIIDIPSYVITIKSLSGGNKLLFVFPLLVGIMTINYKEKDKWLIISIYSTTLISSTIFMKYPIWYYQIINFLIFIFILSKTIKNIKNAYSAAILLIILNSAIPSTITVLNSVRESVKESASLNKYVRNYGFDNPTVWEYARSKDFSLLWGRDWSGDFYYPILQDIYPNLYDLHLRDKFFVKTSAEEFIDFDSFCWRTLFIQKTSYPIFIQLHKKYIHILPYHIPGTPIYVLKNNDC